jgi:hypothetical protein
MKDVGTSVDRTKIPVYSLKSMASNQVHAVLHSDVSSCIKQNNKSNNNWQMRRERLERTWGKQGESSQFIWDDIYFCRRSRVHGLVFVRALGRLKPNHFVIHLSQRIKDFLVKTKYWMIIPLLWRFLLLPFFMILKLLVQFHDDLIRKIWKMIIMLIPKNTMSILTFLAALGTRKANSSFLEVVYLCHF